MRSCVEILSLGMFCFWLFRAAVEDSRTKLVKRYYWWIAGGAGLCLLLVRGGISWFALQDLAIYMLLQFVLFSKFYGRADCHGFNCCAITLAAYGGNLYAFLWHMLLTFAGLAVIQLCRKNVNSKGNLKVPVALIPYLTGTFVICLWFLLWERMGA